MILLRLKRNLFRKYTLRQLVDFLVSRHWSYPNPLPNVETLYQQVTTPSVVDRTVYKRNEGPILLYVRTWMNNWYSPLFVNGFYYLIEDSQVFGSIFKYSVLVTLSPYLMEVLCVGVTLWVIGTGVSFRNWDGSRLRLNRGHPSHVLLVVIFHETHVRVRGHSCLPSIKTKTECLLVCLQTVDWVRRQCPIFFKGWL